MKRRVPPRFLLLLAALLVAVLLRLSYRPRKEILGAGIGRGEVRPRG
jgi:hypothetical protein